MSLSTLHNSCYNYITRLVSGNIYASIQNTKYALLLLVEFVEIYVLFGRTKPDFKDWVLFTPERSSTSISIFKWNKISSYLHDALTKGGPFQEFWDHGHSGDVDEPTWYHGYLTTLT